METGLVAMVDNVLTTDVGQASVLDVSGLSAALEKGRVVFIGSPIHSGRKGEESLSAPFSFWRSPREWCCLWLVCSENMVGSWVVLASSPG